MFQRHFVQMLVVQMWQEPCFVKAFKLQTKMEKMGQGH